MNETERMAERKFYLGVIIGTLSRMGEDNMYGIFQAIEEKDYDEAMKISFKIENEHRESKEIQDAIQLFRKVIYLAIMPNQDEVRQEMSELIKKNAKKESAKNN